MGGCEGVGVWGLCEVCVQVCEGQSVCCGVLFCRVKRKHRRDSSGRGVTRCHLRRSACST